MSEQTPLKSDTDKPEETTTTETTTEIADDGTKKVTTTKTTKIKIGKFFKRDKPADKAGETADEKPDMTTTPPPTAEATDATGAVKKPVWPPKWLQRKTLCEDKQEIFGLNMIDRDEKGLNEHIKLNFEDILAEADPTHSNDCTWRMAYRVFTGVRLFFYKLFSALLVLPATLLWGFVFAVLAALNVWCAVPGARAVQVPSMWLAKSWNFIVRSLLDPITRSFGLCLSSMSMRRYGINMETTAEVS